MAEMSLTVNAMPYAPTTVITQKVSKRLSGSIGDGSTTTQVTSRNALKVSNSTDSSTLGSHQRPPQQHLQSH